MVYAADSKSADRKVLRVRIPPRLLLNRRYKMIYLLLALFACGGDIERDREPCYDEIHTLKSKDNTRTLVKNKPFRCPHRRHALKYKPGDYVLCICTGF